MMISLNIRIVLKRVSVSSETIIADIRQITLRKFLIINEQTTASQFFYLLMQSKRAFSIIHLNSKTSPGALILREAWEVILSAKLTHHFTISKHKTVKSSNGLLFNKSHSPIQNSSFKIIFNTPAARYRCGSRCLSYRYTARRYPMKT